MKQKVVKHPNFLCFQLTLSCWVIAQNAQCILTQSKTSCKKLEKSSPTIALKFLGRYSGQRYSFHCFNRVSLKHDCGGYFTCLNLRGMTVCAASIFPQTQGTRNQNSAPSARIIHLKFLLYQSSRRAGFYEINEKLSA